MIRRRKVYMRSPVLCLAVFLAVSVSNGFSLAQGAPPATPERTVELWMTYMQRQSWDQMVKIAQLTWLKGKDPKKAAQQIANNYDFFQVKSWKITDVERQTGVACKVTVEVMTQLGRKTMEAKVIREAAPFTPSKSGKWGVNPISAMLR
jgi:hypothetical protein